MKIDPYKHKEKYFSWKESVVNGISNLSDKNSQLVLDYICDMEHGMNVANGSKKGARGYPRLNNLKQRIIFLINQFEQKYNLIDVTKISERTLHEYFTGIRNEINSEGKVAYSEGFQAWNIIRLKKELFSEFPQLKEKISKFSYKLLLFRDYEELLKKIKNLNQKETMPLLMWLYKD